MALEFIQTQPIVFDPQEDCPECDTRCFCQTYLTADTLYWQGKQTPCEEIEVCSTDSEDLISNGEFTDNADDWSLALGWSWSAGKICWHESAFGTYATQSIPSLVTGKTYIVKFTVSGYTSPGSVTPVLGGTAGASIQLDGEYSVLIECGATTDFSFFAIGQDGCIDNVSIFESCWQTDNDNLTYSEAGLCHTAGGISVATQPVLTIGSYYKAQITISNYTAGSVTVGDGVNVWSTLNNNGVFEMWGTAAATDFTVTFSSDFDGCVQSAVVYKYKNDFSAALINSEDGSFVADITDGISYYKEWVTIIKEGLDEGCYKLALFNECCHEGGHEFLCNGDFSINDDEEGACWTLTETGNVTSRIDDFIAEAWDIFFNDSNEATATIKQEVDVCKNRHYRFSFDYDSAIKFGYTVSIKNAEGLNVIVYTGLVPSGTDTISVSIDLCIGDSDIWETPITFELEIQNGEQSGQIQIDNTSLVLRDVEISRDCADHYSNCFCVKTTANCKERVLMGYSDTPAYGFEFTNTGFKLQVRTVIALDKMSEDGEETSYVYSNGVHETAFSQSEPFETLFIEQVDKITHHSIRVMRRLKHFYIGDSNDVLTEYFVKKGDYTPEWIKDEFLKLAPARFDVSKKGSIGFMTNC